MVGLPIRTSNPWTYEPDVLRLTRASCRAIYHARFRTFFLNVDDCKSSFRGRPACRVLCRLSQCMHMSRMIYPASNGTRRCCVPVHIKAFGAVTLVKNHAAIVIFAAPLQQLLQNTTPHVLQICLPIPSTRRLTFIRDLRPLLQLAMSDE